MKKELCGICVAFPSCLLNAGNSGKRLKLKVLAKHSGNPAGGFRFYQFLLHSSPEGDELIQLLRLDNEDGWH